MKNSAEKKRTMPRAVNRRTFLGLSAGAAAFALAGCSSSQESQLANRIMPDDPLVADYEKKRRTSGQAVSQKLSAAALTADSTGTALKTWAYNGNLAAPVIRVTAGDSVTAELVNQLAAPTTVHWHGVALRNDADGVPGLTQDGIAPGASYNYAFTAPHPGTYWYHSHVELQRDRALYGAFVIEDPQEKLRYDKDWVVVLDDWLDGVTGTPR